MWFSCNLHIVANSPNSSTVWRVCVFICFCFRFFLPFTDDHYRRLELCGEQTLKIRWKNECFNRSNTRKQRNKSKVLGKWLTRPHPTQPHWRFMRTMTAMLSNITWMLNIYWIHQRTCRRPCVVNCYKKWSKDYRLTFKNESMHYETSNSNVWIWRQNSTKR